VVFPYYPASPLPIVLIYKNKLKGFHQLKEQRIVMTAQKYVSASVSFSVLQIASRLQTNVRDGKENR
jgi:hypothetical protein